MKPSPTVQRIDSAPVSSSKEIGGSCAAPSALRRAVLSEPPTQIQRGASKSSSSGTRWGARAASCRGGSAASPGRVLSNPVRRHCRTFWPFLAAADGLPVSCALVRNSGRVDLPPHTLPARGALHCETQGLGPSRRSGLEIPPPVQDPRRKRAGGMTVQEMDTYAEYDATRCCFATSLQ